MITLELKFENEAAKEKVADFLVNEFDLEVTDGVAPNNTERTGDTIFFTRQPEVEEVSEGSQDTTPEKVEEVSETVTETTEAIETGAFTEDVPTAETSTSEPLPEVSTENVTPEEEDEYIDEDTPQTMLEHLEDIKDAVEDEISEVEEGR